MGLFSVLNIGTRGLSASQLGMDITGQNIANADVEGYSRKRLNIASRYRYDEKLGQMGFGVEVVSIDRIRNTFIDKQIRMQNQDVGMYEELDHTLENIENIFTEPSDSGIMNFIDQFFDSWENLTSNPADVAARTIVKTNGGILCNVFQNISSELRDYSSTRNDEIKNCIENVNEILAEIFNLNKEIATVEIGDQNANDSRDHRDMLLKKLSKLISIDVIENDVGQISITTAGNLIVSPVDIQELEISTTTFTRQDGSNFTNIGVRFSNSKRVYMPQGGAMKGLIDSRDIHIPEYETYIDTLAIGIVERVNQQHILGYNLMGYNGFDFFDRQTTGASNINLCASIESDVNNIAAALAQSSQPATTNTVAAGALNFGNIYQLTTDGVASTGAADPDNARNIVQDTVVVNVGPVALVENIDYSVNYITGTIQMLHNGYDGNGVTVDYDYVVGGYAGPGDNANAVEIAKLRHELTMEPDVLGSYTATFDQFYGSFIGKLGYTRSEAVSNLETREFLVEQYETHQDSIAGVSLDEEMTELIKFQHTYQACARIISTANSMLDTLINM